MSRTAGTFSFILMCFISFKAAASCPPGSTPDSVDVHHYTVSLDVTDIQGQHLLGNSMIRFSPEYNDLSALQLDLLRMEVDSVVLEGTNASFLYNDTTIRLLLPAGITPTDTLTATVYYHGHPIVESGGWGGFHFSGNTLAYNLGVALADTPHTYGRVWHPCIDRFDEKASYEFYIKVNDPLVAVCNGTLIDTVQAEPGKTIFHWQLAQEIPAYLASVAVSNYALVSGNYTGSPPDTIPTSLYVRPQDTLKARQSFTNLNPILYHFIQRFGPYRWPRVGFTGTPIGAMEHATTISYPNNSINGTLNDEWLYAHEMSHSWFGNLVTCRDAGDMWINEGWAVFAEGIYREALYNDSRDYLRAKHRDVLRQAHHADGGYYPLAGIPSHLTYGSTTYDKGGMVVHTLRGYLGDSVFFNTIKQYTDSFAYRNISSSGLRDFFASRSGTDLTDFFDTWVFSAGFPHFSIDSFTVQPNGSLYDVTVHVRQRMKGTSHISNSNRLFVLLSAGLTTVHRDTVFFSGLTAQRTFQLPFIPVMVIPDPDEKIADATTDKGEVILNPGMYAFPEMYCTVEALQVPDTSAVWIIHHWVAPDSLPEPVPGFRLSPQRYWTVAGILPAGFRAKGSFKYSRFSYLDHELIFDAQDSLVLLYRPSPAWPWQSIPFTQVGATVLGELVVDSLRLGEYTLGIWDHTFLSIDEQNPDHQSRVFPNPAREEFSLHLVLDEAVVINMSDVSGKRLDSLRVGKGKQTVTWVPPGRKPGLYFFSLTGESSKKTSTMKAVLLP